MKSAQKVCLVLGIFLAGGGCAHPWQPPRLTRPNQYQATGEQLVIHSDFPLSEKARLVETLLARRNDLSQHLQLPLADTPIDIYLFRTAAEFQSYVKMHYPQFPSRRAFFVENDGQLAVYAQWGDRVEEDLQHETTHAFLHAAVPEIPLWLDEGLAEYYETPRGTGGWNREHVLWLRTQLSQGRWQPNLVRLEHLPPTADMNEADYAEAWLWVHYLLQSFSEQREMLRGYLADLRSDTHTAPLSARLRESFRDPDRELVEHARPLIARDVPPQVSE